MEANLFGHAKSFMEALAHIRPVLIIDEPHRFEGKVVQEYLAKFNPLLTIRFGATFKGETTALKYRNLIYTLDSLEAFRQKLVKGITVDTVGAGGDTAQVLCFNSVSGSAKERTAQVEAHAITNTEIAARSLYTDAFMPVDSKIERDTVDESNQSRITVFAKLPKINIPTPVGNYNPDFGYAIHSAGKTQALYLVVETKGYDSEAEIPTKEKWKIASARHFFKALQDLPVLKDRGVKISFETKINGDSLVQLISGMK